MYRFWGLPETDDDYLIDGSNYAPVTGWYAMIWDGAFEVYPYEGAKESSVTNFSDWFMTSPLFEANSEDGLEAKYRRRTYVRRGFKQKSV